MVQGVLKEVRQIIERVPHEFLEVRVDERVEREELAFLWIPRQIVARELLAAPNLQLEVLLAVLPARDVGDH